MGRTQPNKLLAPMALVLALAVGAFAAWIFLFMCGMATFGGFFNSVGVMESISVQDDGRVLICSQRSIAGQTVFNFRTLDGKEVVNANSQQPHDSITLSAAPLPSNTRPLAWPLRIQGFADLRQQPHYWYLIREDKSFGLAYFEIFDAYTSLRVGYFGRKGFQAELPTEGEQFGETEWQCFSTVNLPPSRYYGSSFYPRIYGMYLIADGSLDYIDFEERRVRTIPVPGRPVAARWVDQSGIRETDMGNRTAFIIDADEKGNLREKEVEVSSRNTDDVLIVRTTDSILLADRNGAVRRTLSIPEKVRDDSLTLMNWDAPQPILTNDNRFQQRADVYWLASPDTPERHEIVDLVNYGTTNHFNAGTQLLYATLVFPVPIAHVFIYPMVSEDLVESGDASSLGDALGQIISVAWPGLVLMLILSTVAAFICYRHHCRNADRGAAAWAVFVFLTGVFGAIGYWLHRTWPARARCPSCGAVVPRNREACLSCAVEFPPPELRGIEIFA